MFAVLLNEDCRWRCTKRTTIHASSMCASGIQWMTFRRRPNQLTEWKKFCHFVNEWDRYLVYKTGQSNVNVHIWAELSVLFKRIRNKNWKWSKRLHCERKWNCFNLLACLFHYWNIQHLHHANWRQMEHSQRWRTTMMVICIIFGASLHIFQRIPNTEHKTKTKIEITIATILCVLEFDWKTIFGFKNQNPHNCTHIHALHLKLAHFNVHNTEMIRMLRIHYYDIMSKKIVCFCCRFHFRSDIWSSDCVSDLNGKENTNNRKRWNRTDDAPKQESNESICIVPVHAHTHTQNTFE